MAYFLIVGQEPCTIPKILGIMKSVDGLSRLHSSWEKIAALFGVHKNELPSNVRNVESMWFELLHTWKEKKGDFATLGSFCTVISSFDPKRLSDILFIEFAKILAYQILNEDDVFVDGDFVKMRDIFVLPPWIPTQPKANDPMMISRHSLTIPNKLISRDWMGRTFDKFVKELNKTQLEIVQKYCFKKLSMHSLASTMDIKKLNNEDEARQLITKMNLTNYGMSFFYWFIVAKSVVEITLEDQWRMRLMLEKVFDIVDEYEVDDNSSLRFRNIALVFFIDWLLGLKDEKGLNVYVLQFHVEDPSMIQYAIACVKINAVNLLNHILSYHSILHKVVQNTMWFGVSDLEMRKRIALQIITENPNSVNILDHSNLPVLHKTYVHVQLLKLVIEKGADVEKVDERGRNFIHRLIQYYPSEQFYELVHFLLERNQIHLLNAKDMDQQTPLILAPQQVLSVNNADTINLLASYGVDFNVHDRYGYNFLYYGITWKKCVGILQALVECGANWRWRGPDYKTLLHVAAEDGNLGAMKYLVGLGLDVSARDVYGNTPIDDAITSYVPNRNEVIKFLLQQW